MSESEGWEKVPLKATTLNVWTTIEICWKIYSAESGSHAKVYLRWQLWYCHLRHDSGCQTLVVAAEIDSLLPVEKKMFGLIRYCVYWEPKLDCDGGQFYEEHGGPEFPNSRNVDMQLEISSGFDQTDAMCCLAERGMIDNWTCVWHCRLTTGGLITCGHYLQWRTPWWRPM